MTDVTHSYRSGGNWALMNGLADLSADELELLKRQVASYQAQRDEISRGKVCHHVWRRGRTGRTRPARSTRSGPGGLEPDARYTVYFEVDLSVYSMPGAQLMQNGVRVMLPTPYSSDVVHFERVVRRVPAVKCPYKFY